MVVMASDCVSLIEDEIALPPSLLCRVGVCSRFLCPRTVVAGTSPPPPLPACLPPSPFGTGSTPTGRKGADDEKGASLPPSLPPSRPSSGSLAPDITCHVMSPPVGRSVHICWDSERMSLDGSKRPRSSPSFLPLHNHGNQHHLHHIALLAEMRQMAREVRRGD